LRTEQKGDTTVRRHYRLLSVFLLLGSTNQDSYAILRPGDEDKAAVAGGNNTFAIDLYTKPRVEKGNLFFSPFSISTALAMTHAGARGTTDDRMAKVLRFSLASERLHHASGSLIGNLNKGGTGGEYQLAVANALWGQKGFGFLSEFISILDRNYGASLNEVLGRLINPQE
jgi:serpin B